MSVKVMVWVFEHSEATLADRLVLLALADEANDDGGSCYPGQRRLAAKARVAVSTARLSLERLAAANEILVAAAPVSGRGHLTRYLVVMGRPLEDCRCLLAAELKGAEIRHLPGEERAGTRGNARPDALPPAPSLLPSTQDPRDTDPAPLEPKPSRARRSDPRSDEITKTWWERFNEKPLQPYLAVRGLVDKALKAGWTPEAVTASLALVEPPVVGWKLEDALRRGRSSAKPANPAAFRWWENGE